MTAPAAVHFHSLPAVPFLPRAWFHTRCCRLHAYGCALDACAPLVRSPFLTLCHHPPLDCYLPMVYFGYALRFTVYVAVWRTVLRHYGSRPPVYYLYLQCVTSWRLLPCLGRLYVSCKVSALPLSPLPTWFGLYCVHCEHLFGWCLPTITRFLHLGPLYTAPRHSPPYLACPLLPIWVHACTGSAAHRHALHSGPGCPIPFRTGCRATCSPSCACCLPATCRCRSVPSFWLPLPRTTTRQPLNVRLPFPVRNLPVN